MVQDLNKSFLFARTVVFGIATFFALIVLALAAAITNFTSTLNLGYYFPFAALAIATAILTFLTLPVSWFLSTRRKGAITSMVAIELGWTWFLWIMWLSVAAESAGSSWVGNCNVFFGVDNIEALCRETQALTALGFLTWLLLLAYAITLLTLVIRQHMRGNSGVWTGFVTETDFVAEGSNGATHHEGKGDGAAYNTPTVPSQYPPQTQPTYPQA